MGDDNEYSVSPLMPENHTHSCSSNFSNESQNFTNTKYGELVVIGYNGSLPEEDSRRKSKFELFKRPHANGVKPSNETYSVKAPQFSKDVQNSTTHSAIYKISKTESVVVKYIKDDKTDMFQIGRLSESPIDFIVDNIVPGNKLKYPRASNNWISRYACRIIIDREYPYTARIQAAGFDSTCNIFLGEKAIKWQTKPQIDGLTTNGIVIMHPKGSFCSGDAVSGHWKEVSVCGDIMPLRDNFELESQRQSSQDDEKETNILKDGSIIDLCGATLLWRTWEGLAKSPTKHELETFLDEMNAGRPQCPVGRNTLVIPQKRPFSSNSDTRGLRQPFLYLPCGHVQGHHDWGHEKNGISKCPLCMQPSRVVKLCLGNETAFYVDVGPPNYAFNPCGHIASERTVKYWVNIPIPNGRHSISAVCPFCATPTEGYVKIILQDHLT